jgi:hypothetical protein
MTTTAPTIPGYSERMPEARYVPAPLGGTNDRMLAALADALRDQVIEGFRLYDVQVEAAWRPEADDEVVRVRLLMDDPAPGEPTWPMTELRALDRTIRERAWSLGIGEEVYVRHVALRSARQAGIPAETLARACDAAR